LRWSAFDTSGGGAAGDFLRDPELSEPQPVLVMENIPHPIPNLEVEDEAFIEAHPLGAGGGAAAGFTAGAVLGSTMGPIGTAVGAVIGTVAGAFAGDAIADRIDAAAEDAYWREHHHAQPYAAAIDPFEDFAPAYRIGYSGFRRGVSFQDREAELRMEYEGGPLTPVADVSVEGPRTVRAEVDPSDIPGTMQYNMSTHPRSWDEAREAVQAAYERMAQRLPAGNSGGVSGANVQEWSPSAH
jgi:hypothetical protein